MRKILLSHSDDPAMLALVSPIFEHYASSHGYECRIHGGRVDVGGRSPHWSKVRLIQQSLPGADLVTWFDADVIIRTSQDVADGIASEDAHGLVMEQTPHGVGPNTGVWVLRSGALDLIDEVWDRGQLPDATLHDQATVAHLMGFSYLPSYTRPLRSSAWLCRTSWLDWRWNVLRVFNPESASLAHALHFAGMGPERIPLMRQQIVDDRLAGWENLLDSGTLERIQQWDVAKREPAV